MKHLLYLPILFFIACGTSKQYKVEFTDMVDASCGKCNFGMTGDKCDLAVKLGDKHYYVVGSAIDDHGNEHATDGLCSTTRKAKVTGRVKGGVFVASSFELLPK